MGSRTIAEYAQFSFAFTREDGAFVDDSILSYGQKRMLALLYQMRAHDGPFVADELVNGLHHAWIDLLLEELGSRQSFVSTQSPLLLDYLERLDRPGERLDGPARVARFLDGSEARQRFEQEAKVLRQL